MKFQTRRDILLKGLQSTQNAINTKTTLPILSNILIQARENDTILTATDTEIGIISKIPIKADITGSITIPAKKFLDIIKELPESEVLISVKKNNQVHIECEKCSFKIMGLPTEEFPQPPEFKEKDSITIPQKQLKKMITLTEFAMSSGETRHTLEGVLFVIKPSFIRLVATDGRRMAIAEFKIQLPKAQERKAIVPSKAVAEVCKVLSDEGDVKIVFTESQVLFDVGNTRIISRLIEGEFPNYEVVIPKEIKEKLRVNRQALLSALKRVGLFTNAESMAVKIDVGRDSMVLSKSTQYLGDVREELGVEYKGKEMTIGFKPEYLIDALKAIDQEKVDLELADAEKPGVMRVADEYVYMVMPMQVT